ncbi:hypothetical protein NIIDNTM18_26850 [Mycolicibacterium litorale]|uniref:Uncharacterized protein n=1 Tax=Mycolicibacterium litorale TaxID=758802 RepID=A0A6S6P7J5_9MYCO|nr:hypothetical protein [Mycolicibacterium litorale]BCI53407.1 hypothetical protein NIIDNTM18_26850 [Mycolicibacterium litorale]
MTVAPDELTGTEQAVLLVLMAECRPVPNPELKTLGPELKKPSRDRLRRLNLIDVKAGSPMVLDLTDDGWAVCRTLFDSDAPPGVRGQSRALYTLLKSLGRYLERADLAPADVFASPAEPEVGDVAARVRQAYARLVRSPGGWLGLAALRDALDDVPRDDLDSALVALYQQPGVSLIPEENQKALTDADDAAAVRIGGQRKHLIAMAL